MLFGRKKDGFSKTGKVNEYDHKVDESQLQETETETKEGAATIDNEKPDLLDYIDSLNESEEPFPTIEEENVVEEDEKTEAQVLADFIRARSDAAHLTSKTLLKKEDESINILLEEINKDETCQDIVSIKGDKDIYFYSDKLMSDNYAMIALFVEEKNIPKTIAEMVRWNAKTYPCATPLYYFKNSPYNYTEAQILRAVNMVKMNEEYSDIGELTTGNDVRYLYSTLHMSEKYARALAEGVEYGEYGYVVKSKK